MLVTDDWILWLIIVGLVCLFGILFFAWGTRWAAGKKGHCEVEYHWWFGSWVGCAGGESCPAGKTCTLLWRKKDSEEEWADAGIVPGGSMKESDSMEYRCLCR